MDSVSFVDKSFTKDLSYIDYNVSKNFFLKSQKNSTFLLDFSKKRKKFENGAQKCLQFGKRCGIL